MFEKQRFLFHHTAVNGWGRVVAVLDDPEEIATLIDKRNMETHSQYETQRGACEQIADEGDRNKYLFYTDDAEKRHTLYPGPYLSEGEQYLFEGIFESAPVPLIHGLAHRHYAGNFWQTEDGNLSDGAHR